MIFFLLKKCVTCNRRRRLSVQAGANNGLRTKEHKYICLIFFPDVKYIQCKIHVHTKRVISIHVRCPNVYHYKVE